jgi:hypothetical protein
MHHLAIYHRRYDYSQLRVGADITTGSLPYPPNSSSRRLASGGAPQKTFFSADNKAQHGHGHAK